MSKSRSSSWKPTPALTDDDKRSRAQKLKDEWQSLHEQVVVAGRPAHRGHRAPREPAHRQPAARPLRPPGRPRRQPLLPEPGRPAHAHLRRRPRARDHGPAEDARGRGHRGRHRQPQHRERAAQGRGAQLRHPQAAARIRRRRQRPAQGHLPAAQRDPGGGGARRADRQPAPERHDRGRAHLRAGREPGRAVGPGRAASAC